MFYKILIAVLLFIFLITVITVDHWVVIAPELFDRSDAFLIASNGLVFADYGAFLLLNKNEQCILLQLYGSVIGDGEGGTVWFIPCSFKYSQYVNRFTGWIYFRGHARPFCGTQTGVFMQKCKNW
jgi:hypothetical protein